MLALDGPYCPYIHQCDNVPRHVPWSIVQRRLAHYLLVTSLEGKEDLNVEGEEIEIRPGQSYLIQPGVMADLSSQRGNRPIWIHFDLVYQPERTKYRQAVSYDAELGERERWLQPTTKELFDVNLPVVVPKQLTSLFREEVPRLVAQWQQRDALDIWDATLTLSRLMFAWVGQSWRELGLKRPLGVDARLRQAEELARARLGTAFGVPEFAEAAGLSRTRFSTVYRERRGVGPATFLRKERIKQARQLLICSDKSIAEIGASVGYPEPTVFGRVFRLQTGKSPSAFRDRERQRAERRA
jgi:AraC-like DNA-binding protein